MSKISERIIKRNELKNSVGNVIKLDSSNMLSKSIIKEFNYFDMKEKVLETSKNIHWLQWSYLDENLWFEVDSKNFKISCNNKSIKKTDNTKIVSLNFSYYDKSVRLTLELFEKFITAWNRLNGVERFILYNNVILGLERGGLTDEDMIIQLGIYKDKYNHYKHSSYIKFGMLLGLNEELLMFNGILFE